MLALVSIYKYILGHAYIYISIGMQVCKHIRKGEKECNVCTYLIPIKNPHKIRIVLKSLLDNLNRTGDVCFSEGDDLDGHLQIESEIWVRFSGFESLVPVLNTVVVLRDYRTMNR